MARLTLSMVLGLGVIGGLVAQTETASAAFPVTADCGPGYRSNGSAFYTPYGRSVVNSMNYNRYSSNYGSYDRYGYNGNDSRYGNKFDCGTNSAWDRSNSRYGSWDNNARYSDYSRMNRIRDAYNDRYDDYRHDHRSYNNGYRY